MTYTTGEWHVQYDDGVEEVVFVDKIDTAESELRLSAVQALKDLEMVATQRALLAGADRIEHGAPHPNDPRPDGNRAQRRAYRFGRRTV